MIRPPAIRRNAPDERGRSRRVWEASIVRVPLPAAHLPLPVGYVLSFFGLRQ